MCVLFLYLESLTQSKAFFRTTKQKYSVFLYSFDCDTICIIIIMILYGLKCFFTSLKVSRYHQFYRMGLVHAPAIFILKYIKFARLNFNIHQSKPSEHDHSTRKGDLLGIPIHKTTSLKILQIIML